MAGRPRRAGWGLLVALTGCAVFDPSQPIALVPAEDATPEEVASLEAAGECWNLGFGMQFVVTRSPMTEQAVFVQYDNLVCIGAPGTFTPGIPARIDLCPLEYQPTHNEAGQRYAVSYFNTVLHELGHAAGIRAEGSDQRSVMGRNTHAYEAEVRGYTVDAFAREDYELFADEHPDFTIEPACTVKMDGDPLSGARCYCP